MIFNHCEIRLVLPFINPIRSRKARITMIIDCTAIIVNYYVEKMKCFGTCTLKCALGNETKGSH